MSGQFGRQLVRAQDAHGSQPHAVGLFSVCYDMPVDASRHAVQQPKLSALDRGRSCGPFELSGSTVEAPTDDVIEVVVGRSQHSPVCFLTAEGAGRPVVDGPLEAATVDNVVVQARLPGPRAAPRDVMRTRIAGPTALRRFEPA